MAKKYPIGTRIKFLNRSFDTGETGTIVGYWNYEEKPVIYLPAAKKHIVDNYYPILNNGSIFTWKCGWDELEILVQKGQQLLFSFMEEEYQDV